MVFVRRGTYSSDYSIWSDHAARASTHDQNCTAPAEFPSSGRWSLPIRMLCGTRSHGNLGPRTALLNYQKPALRHSLRTMAVCNRGEMSIIPSVFVRRLTLDQFNCISHHVVLVLAYWVIVDAISLKRMGTRIWPRLFVCPGMSCYASDLNWAFAASS